MIAGLDIGNSTTELVIWDESQAGGALVTTARRRTRGEKGSAQSLLGAAELLFNTEHRRGVRVDAVALCDLAPVRMLRLDPVTVDSSAAGVLRLDPPAPSTPGGSGVGVGVHVPIADLAAADPGKAVIVSVPDDVGYEQAAAEINAAVERGWSLAGGLVAADEGVLIANRLRCRVPLVDEVDLACLAPGRPVVVEVADPGGTVRTLSDPLALASALGLGPDALGPLTGFARAFASARSGAVALVRDTVGEVPDAPAWELIYSGSDASRCRIRLPDQLEHGLTIRPGDALALEGNGGVYPASDVWTLHLPAVAAEVRLRPGIVKMDATLFAALTAEPNEDFAAQLSELVERPVHRAGSEAAAARRGALTTPNAPQDALVCDLGGGTIDVVGEGWHRIAAGAGEMLTSAVSHALSISRIAAEYVKRGPSMRLETEMLALHESGERVFRTTPAPTGSVAWLCVEGPGRLLPFSSTLSPGEWQALRRALKEHVLGANIRRCLGASDETGAPLLLCGGGAADEELVAAVTDGLHALGIPVSRANVAGCQGPRYAVALGAAMSISPTS